jgi:hypothetical protein
VILFAFELTHWRRAVDAEFVRLAIAGGPLTALDVVLVHRPRGLKRAFSFDVPIPHMRLPKPVARA